MQCGFPNLDVQNDIQVGIAVPLLTQRADIAQYTRLYASAASTCPNSKEDLTAADIRSGGSSCEASCKSHRNLRLLVIKAIKLHLISRNWYWNDVMPKAVIRKVISDMPEANDVFKRPRLSATSVGVSLYRRTITVRRSHQHWLELAAVQVWKL